MSSSSNAMASSSTTRPTRPSDTFRPRGRLPLDPFASPVAHSRGSYGLNQSHLNPVAPPAEYHQGYGNALASSSSLSTALPSSSARRDSGSSTGSGHEGGEHQMMGYAPMWKVPKAIVYGGGYAGFEGYDGWRNGSGNGEQVVLVLGDPPAQELLPLLSSPHLADPTTSLVLIATTNPPGYLHQTTQGPAIRILRLAQPLDAHQGGALRLVSLFERAGRVVDAWRAGVGRPGGKRSGSGSGSGSRRASVLVKDRDGASWRGAHAAGNVGSERIVQLAEDASGEFVCVEAYRPAPAGSGDSSESQRPRYPSPAPSEHERDAEKEREKDKKKRFRFSMGMGGMSPDATTGSDSPKPLIESRLPSSPSPLASSSTPSSTKVAHSSKTPKAKSHSLPVPASPYSSTRLNQSSHSMIPPLMSRSGAPGSSSLTADGGRTFDAIINFLPGHAPDKALLKHAILVSTLGAQYLGVNGAAGEVATVGPGVPGQGRGVGMGVRTDNAADSDETPRLRKRPSRRMSMTQRLSGFFGLGSADEKALKEIGERQDKEKQKERELVVPGLGLSSARVMHAHVVHILPPNMANAQERPHGHKLVQSIEQFLLNFAYPLGSMLPSSSGGGGGGRGSSFGYGYAGSSGSMSSLSSLGSVGVQLNNMGLGVNGGPMGGSALSSTASSRNSSSSSLSAMGASGNGNPHVYASSSQTLSQSQSQAQQAQTQPRSRSLFSIGTGSGSRRNPYVEGSSSNESGAVQQKNHKPTTPPSAYSAPHMQRQRVRSGGASPHRPSSMYSNSAYGHGSINHNSTTGMSGSGSLAQLAAQMAGRPVPFLVAPGAFGAPISPAMAGGARMRKDSNTEGARRMTYGEAMLLGILDWDSGLEGGFAAAVRGAGRAYVGWGDVVCDGGVESEEAVEDDHLESVGFPVPSESLVDTKKHLSEMTPRPAPTTTQLPTPPESSVGSSESSIEDEVPSTAVVDLDKTPRFSSTSRFTRAPSSSTRSSGSSVESGAQALPAEATSLTSLASDPSRTVEPAAGSVNGTETNGAHLPSSRSNVRLASSSSVQSLQLKKRNHRPAPPPPSMSSTPQDIPAVASGLPEMVRDDPLRISVVGSPILPPIVSTGGIDMKRSNDEGQSQDGDAPFFSAVSSPPIAEPPMMITLTSATVASVDHDAPQSGAAPRITTNGSDSGYGSTESADAHEAHATPLSHKAARPLHVSSTAHADMPEETQKAVQDAVDKLVGEAESTEEGPLSRKRSPSLKRRSSDRGRSRTRDATSPTVASPVVPQESSQPSPAGKAKPVGKDVVPEAGKNGKLQGAWRKFGSWRRNGGSLPAVESGANPTA